MIVYTKENIKELLEEGIAESQESDEYTRSTKKGLRNGLGDNPRKSQLKNLQSGTEKILKALYLKNGHYINIHKNSKKWGAPILLDDANLSEFDSEKTHSLNFLTKHLSELKMPDISENDILILEKINKANEIKHATHYELEEIPNVRPLLDKLVNLTLKKNPTD